VVNPALVGVSLLLFGLIAFGLGIFVALIAFACAPAAD